MTPDIERADESEQPTSGRIEEFRADDGSVVLKKFDEGEDKVKVARVEFRRKEGRVFLKVKSAVEWENWLKSSREVKERTSGLFKNSGAYKFYSGTLQTTGINVASFDAMEGTMFFYDTNAGAWFLNLAIFRLEVVSRGVTLECSDLIPSEQVGVAIRNSFRIIERIYSDYIRRTSVVVEMRVA